MRQDLVAIGQSAPHPAVGFTWRHLATVLLLLVVVPVLFLAGAAALMVLPLLLAAIGIDQAVKQARQLRELAPVPHGRR